MKTREVYPLVSIIIPVYEVEEYIKECIDSVLKQKYTNIEIVLIDDRGGDNSIDIARKLLIPCRYSWKIIQHEYNRGLSAARNTGVKHSEGEFIFFLDSDDLITDDCIEVMVNKAIETRAEIIYGAYALYEGGSIIDTHINSERDFDPLRAYILFITPPMAWNRLILKSWYANTKVDFIEGILHEDEPWSLSLALRAKCIDYVKQVTYLYRQRCGSIMNNTQNAKKRIESKIRILEDAAKELNSAFAVWPSYCIKRYFNFQWDVAQEVCSSGDLSIRGVLKSVFQSVRIPEFSPCIKRVKCFFLLRKIIPAHVAFLLIQKLYKFVNLISFKTCQK